MIHERINLSELYPALPKGARPVYLEVFCRSSSPEYGKDRKYPGMLVCPGGGYGFTSAREGEPIALCLLAKGIQSFVLWYSVAPSAYPAQLLETAAAFDYLRRNAEKYELMPDMIGITGFSAGAHLAGSYSTLWNDDSIFAPLGIPFENRRPNAMVLAYGVLTSGIRTHAGSMENLLAGMDSPELREKVSVEKNVGAHTPRAFIWHTFDDGAVPVENSLAVAMALTNAGIPYELHVYPRGQHGLALSNWLTSGEYRTAPPPSDVAGWIGDCCDWFLRLAGIFG